MPDSLQQHYLKDRDVWNACADVYEKRIVDGHPDVIAYEAFEEDFLDRLFLFLGRTQAREMRLFDVGCGSGRLHLRYGLKMAADEPAHPDAMRLRAVARHHRPDYAFDPFFAKKLAAVGGLDFSAAMIDLGKQKLIASGLAHLMENRLSFCEGSAFDLGPLPDDRLPVAVGSAIPSA